MTAQNVSVTVPFSQAIERVKLVLFRPFDVGKWFIIGFCAWLAYLFEGGGWHPGGLQHHVDGRQSARQELETARDYVVANLAWLIPVAIAVVTVAIVVGLIVLWLNSRGKFMFLHCVALNTAQVREPWHRYGPEARSLFLFRLLVSVISLVVMLPLAAGMIISILGMVFRETATLGGVAGAVGFLGGMIVFGIFFWLISRFTRDFVVPIQFLRRSSCFAAWGEFRRLLFANAAHFLLYLLFRIVLWIGISLCLVLLVLATCCIAGCFLAIPYLGTMLLLPVLVFDRAFSLHFLAQFGPDYDFTLAQRTPAEM
jgi:hypothetical protein